jgi:LmbE family N-acetylglucosaminyl deacetylase
MAAGTSGDSLLVVAAHPDDEVLGCGATVALRVAQGWQAHLLIMTGGVAGRTARRPDGISDDQLDAETAAAMQRLRDESERAAELLGFTSVTRWSFPDNRMDTVSRMDVAQAIIPTLERLRPQTLLTHHPGDYNWDHTITFDAVMMAARHSPGEHGPREILAFEVPSSTERAWQTGGRSFHPNVYVDVARTIDKKKLALLTYQSECRPYPHPRSIEALEYLARKRGAEVGLEYAETFELIRRVEG